MLIKLPYVLGLVLLLWSGTSHAQEAQVTGTMTMNTQQRLDKLEHQPQNAVVHTLGFHQLTPLNEIGGKAPKKSPNNQQQPANCPQQPQVRFL